MARAQPTITGRLQRLWTRGLCFAQAISILLPYRTKRRAGTTDRVPRRPKRIVRAADDSSLIAKAAAECRADKNKPCKKFNGLEFVIRVRDIPLPHCTAVALLAAAHHHCEEEDGHQPLDQLLSQLPQ